MRLNDVWNVYLKNNGVDFVRFIDISSLTGNVAGEYACAVLFGKILTKGYLQAIRDGRKPERQEFGIAEHAMDALADKFSEKLASEGYKSVSRIRSPLLPHKTIARLAGIGFIGKNTLLISNEYGGAVVLGKVLTNAPFLSEPPQPMEPQCGECNVCAEICPAKALLGKQWSITTSRNEMLVRKLCNPCMKCMVYCPYTVRYMDS